MKRQAVGAIGAQSVQAAVSLLLQVLVARLLGIDDYGRFAILYGVIVVATGVVSGLVGDSLVVLDRRVPGVRGALEAWLLMAAFIPATVAAVVVAATGFTDAVTASLFGVALTSFVVEEIVRRLLMAGYAFGRVAATDLVGFAVCGGVLTATWIIGDLSLASFFGAIAAGQIVAAIAGWRMLPRSDRWLAGLRGTTLRDVWRYGAWRGLQQTLRPAMLTAVRLLVLGFAGVVAVGLLEAARTYTSPLLLVVGGLSSFLFVRFADRVRDGGRGTLREADRVVLWLVGITVGMSAVALALAAWAGPLAFGVPLHGVAVVAWLVYGVSVAMVTPYGALSAVGGRQKAVFLVRLADTLLSVVVTLIILAAGVEASVVPFGLAFTSALGGWALRWIAAHPHAPGSPAEA